MCKQAGKSYVVSPSISTCMYVCVCGVCTCVLYNNKICNLKQIVAKDFFSKISCACIGRNSGDSVAYSVVFILSNYSPF